MRTQIVPEQIMYQNIRNHIYILPTVFKAIHDYANRYYYTAVQGYTELYIATQSNI